MSLGFETDKALERAKEKEAKFDWLGAAQTYEEAQKLEPEKSSFAAEIWEKIGYCYRFASTQAENAEAYARTRELSASAYKKASELFTREPGSASLGRSEGCYAVSQQVRSWLSQDPSEKRRVLDDCQLHGKESLKAFSEAGDQLSYGKMCNELLLSLLERLYVAENFADAKNIIKEAEDLTDKAISTLLKLGDNLQLTNAYATGSLIFFNGYISGEESRREDFMRKSLTLSEKALALSKQIDNPYCNAYSSWAAAFCNLVFTGKIAAAMEHAEQMLKQGTVVRDNYLMGVASYLLTFIINWAILQEEDPDKKKEGHEKVIKCSKDAMKYLQIVSQDFFIAQTYLFYAETYSSLARDLTTTREGKQALLKEAVEIGRTGLEHAIRSGSADATGSALHALSKALHYFSNLENDRDRKRRLLEEALIHRTEYVKVVKKAFPFNDWILGVGKNYEGLIRAELAKLEDDKGNRIAFLENAVSDMENGVASCRNWVLTHPVPALVAAVARFEDWFGGTLNELYLTTEKEEILKRAVEIYDDTAKEYEKINLSSRAAESYWKEAQSQDLLGEYEKASENFENAFKEYKAAAQKIPHFVSFYLDYATYMQAWSEAERAKIAHKQKEYVAAMERYDRTAYLLKQSRLWNHLSSNFFAWSFLEKAEEASRKEISAESIDAFKRAAELFEETKTALSHKLGEIQRDDEKDLAKSLVEASNIREKYCFGRIAVEEAKTLDRRGEHAASSQKFGTAAEIFQKALETCSKQTCKELKPLAHLCQAWQVMMMAETKSSPTLYREAAELFQQARDYALDEQTSLLALAHSSFCKALEAGTEFEITRDLTFYSTARKHLGASANYYLKAGFTNGSDFVKATQLLFEAYLYVDNAKKETIPENEAKYYTMAERLLEMAGSFYSKANHPEKSQQVEQFLKRVKDERELAVSLSQLLHPSAIASSTASFAMLTPFEERAAGLERFEHADIQTKLIEQIKETRIGEDLDLNIQIANVGKESVLLVRIEEIIPEGFQLITKPNYCQSENGHLTLSGKRIDPLKTEEMKLVIRPMVKGAFEIKPRIICVDETGDQILRGPEPMAIRVTELILPGRVPTGYEDLDNLLLGGIPANYSVILTSPSCDVRDQITKSFLETGTQNGDVTVYITGEERGAAALAQQFQSNFFVFICNPRAEMIIGSGPNVFKLKGVENLTDIDIALTKVFHKLETEVKNPRRACIEIVSDVLLQHHATATRKWLSVLLPELRSKGFTTLAIINPLMHPPEEAHAIVGLFEGEIAVYEKETKDGSTTFIKVRKMYNQRYREIEVSPMKRRGDI